MRDIALKIPLRPLHVGRLPERHQADAARVERLSYAFDHAALTRRIASFEQYDQALAALPDPVLEAYELELQSIELFEVDGLRQPGAEMVGGAVDCRIASGCERLARALLLAHGLTLYGRVYCCAAWRPLGGQIGLTAA